MTEVVDRIKQVMSFFRLNQSEFSEKIGMKQQNFSRILNGRVNIGDGVINKIILSFDVSKEWLLTGKGDMLKIDTDKVHPGALLKLYLDEKGITREDFAEKMNIPVGDVDAHLNLRENNMDYMLQWSRSLGLKTTEIFMSADSYLRHIDKFNDIEECDVKEENKSPNLNNSSKSRNDIDLLTTLNIPEPRPYISDTYASCGIPNGFSIAIKKSDCELVSIPFVSDYDFSIRAKGDSMINRDSPNRSIRDKDIIVCKLWGSRSHVRWGEVYALATTEGVIVKKILPSDKENCIKCVSFNTEDNFLPYDLPLEEIFDWATVVGIVSINKW